MTTEIATTQTLPFTVGQPRSFQGLTVVPLFAAEKPRLEYLGLDEAVARGLSVTEVDASGQVGALLVENPLDEPVLLYEGEELAGAKQNRIVRHTVLVEAHATMKIAATCVERSRWSQWTASFKPAPRAAYPEMRRANRAAGQGGVWANVADKSERLQAFSETEAAEAMYVSCSAKLEEYVQALPRLDGQSGVVVGIGGKIVCLDYVSRSDVFAGLYLKLLRGYALDAIEVPLEKPLAKRAVERILASADATELRVEDEVVALTAHSAS
jgi:hypothetical protein